MTSRRTSHFPEVVAWLGGYLFPRIPMPDPPFDPKWREEVFAAERPTELELTYRDAYLDATGAGERTRGAHYRGLKAVYALGRKGTPAPQPTSLDRLRKRLAECLMPKRGF